MGIKELRLKNPGISMVVGPHNAEVEGSSPSLTTKIKELQLPMRGVLREFVGLRRTNLSVLARRPSDLIRTNGMI
jgi:hypothetical protein